jgi:hypothetical protein
MTNHFATSQILQAPLSGDNALGFSCPKSGKETAEKNPQG